ncbi:TRIC cation channel family protein [Granulosicoccus sp.]|nr:TRIC cation channel family protein [Granulosicoccus sp.]
MLKTLTVHFGARVAVEAEFGGIVAIVMGLLSATFGGLIRDVLCNEIPLILRNEIYATAALFGSLVYIVLESLTLPGSCAEFGGVLACFPVRALGLSRGLSLPNYRARAGRVYPTDNKPGF